MRLSLGLSNVVEDAVLAVPVNRLMDAPMLGLAAKRDKGGPLQCHRVVLLVEGTEESDCDTIDEAQIFKITSRNARCLVFVTLAGYSDFKKMMQFRLDKETALVLVSSLPTPWRQGEYSNSLRYLGAPRCLKIAWGLPGLGGD